MKFLLSLLLIISNAEAVQPNAELSVGDLQKITVQKNGIITTYNLDSQIESMWFSDGSLIMGLTSKCDTFLGSTMSEFIINTDVITLGSETPSTPKKAIIHVPSQTKIYGLCGADSLTLVGLTLIRNNNLKLWMRSPTDSPSDEEILEEQKFNAEKLKSAIEGLFFAANSALKKKDYPQIRIITGALARERLGDDQEIILKKIMGSTPRSERSVGAVSRADSHRFYSAFGISLDGMNIAEFISFLEGVAAGKIVAKDQSANGKLYYNAYSHIIGIIRGLSYFPDMLDNSDVKEIAQILTALIQQSKQNMMEIAELESKGQRFSFEEILRRGASSLELEQYFESLSFLCTTSEGAKVFSQVAIELDSNRNTHRDFARKFTDYAFNFILRIGSNYMIRSNLLSDDFRNFLIARGFQFND